MKEDWCSDTLCVSGIFYNSLRDTSQLPERTKH